MGQAERSGLEGWESTDLRSAILAPITHLSSVVDGEELLEQLEVRQFMIWERISFFEERWDVRRLEESEEGMKIEKSGERGLGNLWNGEGKAHNGLGYSGGQDCDTETGSLLERSREQSVEQRLRTILKHANATFSFKRVPSDYYERSFECRRDLLGAASIDHLCKSIVMVNTQAHESVKDCCDPKNSKYYVVVVQYTARLNAEKVRQFVYNLNNGKIPKKRFNMRLAPEEESNALTGYKHNAVTPIGMLTDIPVILSDAITELQPAFFWMGGGEVDLKLGIETENFIGLAKPFVIDCTY